MSKTYKSSACTVLSEEGGLNTTAVDNYVRSGFSRAHPGSMWLEGEKQEVKVLEQSDHAVASARDHCALKKQPTPGST